MFTLTTVQQTEIFNVCLFKSCVLTCKRGLRGETFVGTELGTVISFESRRWHIELKVCAHKVGLQWSSMWPNRTNQTTDLSINQGVDMTGHARLTSQNTCRVWWLWVDVPPWVQRNGTSFLHVCFDDDTVGTTNGWRVSTDCDPRYYLHLSLKVIFVVKRPSRDYKDSYTVTGVKKKKEIRDVTGGIVSAWKTTGPGFSGVLGRITGIWRSRSEWWLLWWNSFGFTRVESREKVNWVRCK